LLVFVELPEKFQNIVKTVCSSLLLYKVIIRYLPVQYNPVHMVTTNLPKFHANVIMLSMTRSLKWVSIRVLNIILSLPSKLHILFMKYFLLQSLENHQKRTNQGHIHEFFRGVGVEKAARKFAYKLKFQPFKKNFRDLRCNVGFATSKINFSFQCYYLLYFILLQIFFLLEIRSGADA
jgi:hypothetical protein